MLASFKLLIDTAHYPRGNNMSKRIVICADGTWNRPEKDLKKDFPTNILKIARAIKPHDKEGTPQQVFYDWGLGSYHDEATAGTTGKGIQKNIMDGYRYIVQNYSPGDELFLFGFSRGAYTVRGLCGLINNCGIIKRPDARLIQQAFDHYKRSDSAYKPQGEKSIRFRKRHAHSSNEVGFLGVFDTVGALGIPLPFMGFLNAEDEFYDSKLGPNLRIARHALAIDERRHDFMPTTLRPRRNLDLKQVWFTGSHSDVGGGYPPDKGGSLLSDIALDWMMREAQKAGLEFEPYMEKRLKPSHTATLHDSSSLKFRSWRDKWRRISRGRGVALIHASVASRRDADPNYRPDNLEKYIAKHRGWRTQLVP